MNGSKTLTIKILEIEYVGLKEKSPIWGVLEGNGQRKKKMAWISLRLVSFWLNCLIKMNKEEEEL